jgi:hypothetical protein
MATITSPAINPKLPMICIHPARFDVFIHDPPAFPEQIILAFSLKQSLHQRVLDTATF